MKQRIRTGDRVRVTIVGDVTGVDSDGVYLFTSSQSEDYIDPNNRLVTSVEKLKHRRPEVGATITGARLKDTWWKRGTVVQMLGDFSTIDLMLLASGQWVSTDAGVFEFDACPDDAIFQVVYLP